ncbi:MAG: DUF502 domain-containing protein [Methyloceanibacter sp.]|nr:DUF502 domain-containing protein [Methyloceanibacter sp.]
MTNSDDKNPKQENERRKPGLPGDDEEDHSLFGALEPTSSHFLARLRGYFLTGLIIVGPVAITIYVVWWFINLVDGLVRPLIPDAYLPDSLLPFNIPGVGLVFGIVGLMLIGALAANLFGRTIVSYGVILLDRMPVVRGVYRLLKQIFTTVFAKQGTSFKRVGLIEFPRRGLYVIVFVSGDPPGEIKEKLDDDELMTVFMPNAPNPTTGFVLFMPAKDVILLDMAIDDGVKLVISAGLVAPKQNKLKELADEAKAKQGKSEPQTPKGPAVKKGPATEEETAA